MVKTVRNKIILLTALTMILGFLFYATAGFFVQDRWIASRVRAELQSDFIGVKIIIKKVRWDGINGISATGVVFQDVQDGSIPFQCEKLTFRFNLLALPANMEHPRRALREISFFKPKIEVKRFEDGTINFSQYLPPGKMEMQFLLKINQGTLKFQDYQYGLYTLHNISGKFNLSKYSLLTWNVKGNANLNKGMKWSSRGRCRLDKLGGTGEFTAAHVAVDSLVPFISKAKQYGIRSGFGSTKLQFAWNKDGVWLNKGVLSLSDMKFKVPRVRDSFVIKNLRAEFTPLECKIKKAEFNHNQTVIRVSGLFNNKTGAIKGLLSAERIRLAEWEGLLPFSQKTALRGEGEARLAIVGTVDKPSIDGEIFIDNGEFLWDRERLLGQIGARIIIRDNNLRIQRLEGNWDDSLIGVRGGIDNIFNPQLNLKIYGSDLKIQSDMFAILKERGLNINGLMDVEGTITGKPTDPKVSGAISARRISCQNVQLEDLNLKLAWDNHTHVLKILNGEANLGDGSLLAKGDIRFKKEGIDWRISGEAVDLSFQQTHFGSEWNIRGKVSSELIFKGSWDKGTPFLPGSVFGIFRGENLAYHDAEMKEASGVFSWINGNLSIDSIQAKIDQGMIYGHLLWNTSEIKADLSAENINIHQIIPDNKTYPLEGIFNGNLSFLGPLQDLTGKIEGVFSDVSWSGRKIGTVSSVLDYSRSGLNISEAFVSTPVGDCRITGRVTFPDQPQLALQLTSDNFQLNALSEWLPATAKFKPSGTAKIDCAVNGKWNNPDISGEISLAEPTFGPIQMEKGLLQFSGNLSEFSIKKFELTKQNTRIELAGMVNPQRIDLDIQGSNLSLEALQLTYGGKNLHGRINLDGKLTGSLTNPVLTAYCSGQQLGYGTTNFQSMEAQIAWQSQTVQIQSVRLAQGQTQVLLEGDISLAKEPSMNLNLKVTALHLGELLNSFAALPKGFETDGLLFGAAKLRGTFDNPQIDVDGFIMQGAINSLPVSGEFAFSYKNRQLTIDNLQLNQGSGVLSADGVWRPGKLSRMNLYLQDFSFQAINPLLDSSYQVNGVVNAYLLVNWSPAVLSGEYRLSVGNMTVNNHPVGDFTTVGHLDNQGISVNESALNRKGIVFSANGYIPWPAELSNSFHLPSGNVRPSISRRLKLDVNLKNFPADFVNVFTPSLGVSQGALDGEIQLGGSLTKPEIVGEIEINNVSAKIEDLPRPIEGFQATVSFDDHRATFKKAKGNYGPGKFNLNGYVSYTGFQIDYLNLGFSGSKIFYNNRYYSGYSNVNLTATGGLTQSQVAGDITLFDSRIVIASSGSGKEETPPVWDPTLSIKVNTRDNVRFRQIGLADIDVSGKLQIGGKWSDPTMEGEATSEQGIVSFYGQTFKINRAKATFTHEQGYMPYIDLNSSLRTSRAEVFLTAKGQVGGDIAINLSAEPFMSRTEIFAMFNWPEFDEEKSSTEVSNILTGNLSMVTDTVFGDFLYQVRNVLDLDYLYLQPNYEENDLRLNVGRNIGKDVFLSYSRSFMYNQKDQWGLDYHINSRLSLGTEYSVLDGTSWRLTYRFGF